MTQQGVDLRFAAPEGLEVFHGRTAAASFQDGFAVASTDIHIEHARLTIGRFFESGVSVGGQYFCPLVTVVARSIAASKNV